MLVYTLDARRSQLLAEAEKWREIAQATKFGVLHDEAKRQAEKCLRDAGVGAEADDT
jgi:hypothetical protein